MKIWYLGCVSLLKSKSGFLIRKRIFRFFTKIQKWIIDPNDPQRRWILWIISKTGYFGYMIRNVSLLRIRKEWMQPAVTRNNFNTYSSCLTTPLIFTAIFELEVTAIFELDFIGMVKSQYKQDLHCTSSQGQIETKLSHNFASASCDVLLSSRYLISRHIFTWPV